MNSKLLSLLIPAIISTALVSCDYVYDYQYQVTNHSDTTIALRRTNYGIDTTIFIDAGSTQVVVAKSHGVEGRGGPFFRDVNLDFDTIIVTKKECLPPGIM
jgi:hypothetical protein